eukprot:CAMPEP_0115049750 /NCGR_PEP_ID=MMETSP0227-20121206/1388_1 /TAXON_ID=89957 /ORGANISM="Polarella glacialis, Strain CCMP 1383" /LENGTH=52 /DNA_ID=CAMNT_0002433501 /DNA_START=371 /DNA_END=529 /DNA_ORIENTATION=+
MPSAWFSSSVLVGTSVLAETFVLVKTSVMVPIGCPSVLVETSNVASTSSNQA